MPLAAPNDSAPLSSLITQIIVAVGGFGGFAAAIGAIFSRRRTNAEAGTFDASAADVLSNTAAAQVQRMDARMVILENQKAEQDARIESLEGLVRTLRRTAEEREEELVSTLDRYADWGALATRTLSEHGIDIAPPPDHTASRSRPPPA